MNESPKHESGGSIKERALQLRQLANEIRFSAMTMTNHSGLGHTGGDLSSADILATLYLGGILNVKPKDPHWPETRPLHHEQRALFGRLLFDTRL